MWWSGLVDGYLRPDQFLDHLTVIIRKWGWETLYTALPAAAPDDKTTEPRTGDPLKKDINAFNPNISFVSFVSLYIFYIFDVYCSTLNIVNHLDALHISQKSNSSCAQYHRQDSYLKSWIQVPSVTVKISMKLFDLIWFFLGPISPPWTCDEGRPKIEGRWKRHWLQTEPLTR